MKPKKGETELPCGCIHNERFWVTMCPKDRAAWAALHATALRDHRREAINAIPLTVTSDRRLNPSQPLTSALSGQETES